MSLFDQPLNIRSPLRVVAWSILVSLGVTTLMMWIFLGEVAPIGLAIAVVAAGPTSYTIAVLFKRYAETIEAQNRQLHTLNAELEAFAHTVAHDLKSPLNTIVVYSDLLQEAPSEEMRNRALLTIGRTGRNMAEIIDGLLLLASVRGEAVERTALDMDSLVDAAWERQHHLIKMHQPTLTRPEAWPPVYGYGPWVEAVWANLLSNAIKYGGEPPHITLHATPTGSGSVRFAVEDNGAGLTEADRAALFQEFARTSSGRIQGHGLGLSIVKRIVEKLGGQVGVESQPGHGSTFWFTLPLPHNKIV